MAYQSLYRRYRPQTFAEMRGQEHVVRALRNAVRDDRVGHAYLLSGPRGTGKTTAARVLAKVLNCANPVDGEPDGTCDSCLAIEAGTSFDLHELDAASNNKVDDIRDLLSKVALGTPGRTKVYLLDEVHMLTSGAENALLKTLEEPPDHVVFILATTEPHKVVSTIRSRTQELDLTLIPADQMTELVREIIADADLDVDEAAIGHVVKAGGGSARDTLSELDKVVSAGGVAEVDTSTADLLEALASQTPGAALQAIEAATGRGADPRRIGETFIDALRSVFLVKMNAAPPRLSEPERVLSDAFAERLTPATITRSLETVGRALVDMRQAPDPRIDLEVAFVRICSVSGDSSPAGLEARIEQLEAALANGGSAPAGNTAQLASESTAAATPPQPVADAQPEPTAAIAEPAQTPAPPTAATGGRPADVARAALKPRQGQAAPAPAPPKKTEPAPTRPGGAPPPPSMRKAVPEPEPEPKATPLVTEEVATDEPIVEASADSPAEAEAPAQPSSTGGPTVDEITNRWGDVLDGQSTPARARFMACKVDSIDGNTVHLVLPTDTQVARCEKYRGEIETALSSEFGTPLQLALRAGDSSTPSNQKSAPSNSAQADAPQHESEVDIHDLTDAEMGNATVVDRIAGVFPGAEVLEKES